MNLSKITAEVNKREAENRADINHIMKGLKTDGYTTERLEKLLAKSNEYHEKFGGSRGNSNVIAAVKKMLNTL